MRAKVPLIGVVGGIASGKSFVSEQFERHGAAVISADALAHEALKLDEVKQAIRERWGEAVFGDDGEVARGALAKIVFAATPEGRQELKYLEKLTHPVVARLAEARIEQLKAQPAAAVVLDVPLMIEAGWNALCDMIVFVDAPRELRVTRALARGWTLDDFSLREAAQESLETKRKLADVVIDNSGSPESVQAQIEHCWHSLLGTLGN